MTKEEKKAYMKDWRERNKERIKEYQKKYNERNKERIKEQKKLKIKLHQSKKLYQ